MNTKAAVDDFLAQRSLAVVGVSRSGKKFGNMAYRELRDKGYQLFPVHPEAEVLEGDKCYTGLSELPEQTGGVLIIVPPNQTEQVVRDAAAAKIPRVWIQQGAESEEAVRFCEEHDMDVVAGECILMFAEPLRFYHKPHRWVWKLLGKLPR
ncbi:MAG: CoA-binding protein [Fidelibacterota bacterium]|nr:MAG: CoA-binding protein [Candidatus Neomarinimicrobiota bacterium]